MHMEDSELRAPFTFERLLCMTVTMMPRPVDKPKSMSCLSAASLSIHIQPHIQCRKNTCG